MATHGTLVSLDDAHVIGDLLARYGWAFDHNEGADYAALFTADASVTGFGDPIPAAGLGALVEGSFAQSGGKWRHHLTNLVLRYDGDADRVIARGYQLVTDWNQPAKLHMTVEAEWTLVREGAGWKIARLHLGIVG